MNIYAGSLGGHNIQAGALAIPRDYPAATIDPVRVKLFMRQAGQAPGDALLVGEFSPTGKAVIPYTPLTDKDVIFSTIAYGPNNQPDVISKAEAIEHAETFTPPATTHNDEFDADTAYKVNGVPVVGPQQPAVADVTASTGAAVAGSAAVAYDAATRTLINNLTAQVNTLKTAVDAVKGTTNTTLSRLREGTGHGLLDV